MPAWAVLPIFDFEKAIRIMNHFSAKILKIGINPYVPIPVKVLNEVFKQADRNKSPIPIHGTLNGFPFIQTLVKYQGQWRLYVNMPMRKTASVDEGDIAHFIISYDSTKRAIEMHPRLAKALNNNHKAKAVFDSLPPYLQKEIVRYISQLKTEASIDSNIIKAIGFLLGKERFIGREGLQGIGFK